MKTTIHRDKTFTYNGRRYQISQGSDQRTVEWDGYSIEAVLSDRPGDFATIEEGFWRLADVRAYLTRAESEGWEYLPDVDGADPHGRTVGDAAEGPWRDQQGDVWALGADGLLHSHETAPFPRAHVEKKWGPLVPLPADDPRPSEIPSPPRMNDSTVVASGNVLGTTHTAHHKDGSAS